MTLSLFRAMSKTSMFLPFANRILYINFVIELEVQRFYHSLAKTFPKLGEEQSK